MRLSREEEFRKSPKDQSNDPSTTAMDQDSFKLPSTGGGVLSSIPNDSHLATLDQMKDSLDAIWANIIIKSEIMPKTLLLCGAATREGASFVSFHLALFLALEYNMKVLFVDTSIDRPQHQNTLVEASIFPGLSHYFALGAPLSSLVLGTSCETLNVLPSGSQELSCSASAMIINRQPLARLIEACSGSFDITIFDGQPVLSSPNMIELAKSVEQVILVCRYAHSRREVSRLVSDKMRTAGIKLAGVVLNDRQYPVPPRIYRMLR